MSKWSRMQGSCKFLFVLLNLKITDGLQKYRQKESMEISQRVVSAQLSGRRSYGVRNDVSLQQNKRWYQRGRWIQDDSWEHEIMRDHNIIALRQISDIRIRSHSRLPKCDINLMLDRSQCQNTFRAVEEAHLQAMIYRTSQIVPDWLKRSGLRV